MLGLAAWLAGCQRPAVERAPALPPEVVGVTWQWIALTAPGEEVAPGAPKRDTIAFQPDGRVVLQADCNRGASTYSVAADRHLTLGPIALTRMACAPGSASDRYVAALDRVTRYDLDPGGDLVLELTPGASLRFRRQG